MASAAVTCHRHALLLLTLLLLLLPHMQGQAVSHSTGASHIPECVRAAVSPAPAAC
jgi:hypothetical protein